PDRLRDYQDRLRVLDERSREQAIAQATDTPAPLLYENAGSQPAPVDPLEAEKKRRDYESLFASNVVVSRRPDGQKPASVETNSGRARAAPDGEAAQRPSLDEVADAVIRATTRQGPANTANPFVESPATMSNSSETTSVKSPGSGGARSTPPSTGPIS